MLFVPPAIPFMVPEAEANNGVPHPVTDLTNFIPAGTLIEWDLDYNALCSLYGLCPDSVYQHKIRIDKDNYNGFTEKLGVYDDLGCVGSCPSEIQLIKEAELDYKLKLDTTGYADGEHRIHVGLLTTPTTGGLGGSSHFRIGPVPDTTPPVITVPSDQTYYVTTNATEIGMGGASYYYGMTTELQGSSGGVYNYGSVTVSDDSGPGGLIFLPDAGFVSCNPQPGSFFSFGTTTVTCTATDTAGNTGTGTFTVTVILEGAATTNCYALSNNSSIEDARQCLGGTYNVGGGLNAWSGITTSAYVNSTSSTGRTLEITTTGIQPGTMISVLPQVQYGPGQWDFTGVTLGNWGPNDLEWKMLTYDDPILKIPIGSAFDDTKKILIFYRLTTTSNFPYAILIGGSNVDGLTTPISVPSISGTEDTTPPVITASAYLNSSSSTGRTLAVTPIEGAFLSVIPPSLSDCYTLMECYNNIMITWMYWQDNTSIVDWLMEIPEDKEGTYVVKKFEYDGYQYVAVETATVTIPALPASSDTASSDTTPPVITVPADITVTVSQTCANTTWCNAIGDPIQFTNSTGTYDGATAWSGSGISWGDATSIPGDGCTGNFSPQGFLNGPVSFPIGTTIVTCTASDAAGNVGTASFTVTVVLEGAGDTTPPEEEIVIPSWIKNNAGWWASNQIDDDSFVAGLQWLISNGIMNIPPTEQGAGSDDVIPGWIKNNAGWWADDLIDDRNFVTGLQWLITNGIMIIG